MSLILIILGSLVAGIGGLWLLVTAFQTSVLWGLGTLLVPLVSLIFVILNWEAARRPFLLQLAGAGMIILGVLFAPAAIAGSG